MRLWKYCEADTDAKTCPTGYSVYVMAAIDGDCLLNVCLKFETFDEINGTMTNGEITGRLRNNLKLASSSGKSHKIELCLSIGGIAIGVLAVGVFQVKKYRKGHTNNCNNPSSMDLTIIKT